jgi:hypothetical protein
MAGRLADWVSLARPLMSRDPIAPAGALRRDDQQSENAEHDRQIGDVRLTHTGIALGSGPVRVLIANEGDILHGFSLPGNSVMISST